MYGMHKLVESFSLFLLHSISLNGKLEMTLESEIGGARADSHLLEYSLLPHAPTTTFFRSIVLTNITFFAARACNEVSRRCAMQFFFRTLWGEEKSSILCTTRLSLSEKKNPITISKCSKTLESTGWLAHFTSRQADEWVPSLKSERIKQTKI